MSKLRSAYPQHVPPLGAALNLVAAAMRPAAAGQTVVYIDVEADTDRVLSPWPAERTGSCPALHRSVAGGGLAIALP